MNYHLQLRGQTKVEIRQPGYQPQIMTLADIDAECIKASPERQMVLDKAFDFLWMAIYGEEPKHKFKRLLESTK